MRGVKAQQLFVWGYLKFYYDYDWLFSGGQRAYGAYFPLFLRKR